MKRAFPVLTLFLCAWGCSKTPDEHTTPPSVNNPPPAVTNTPAGPKGAAADQAKPPVVQTVAMTADSRAADQRVAQTATDASSQAGTPPSAPVSSVKADAADISSAASNPAPASAWSKLGRALGNLTNLAKSTDSAPSNSTAAPAGTVALSDLPTDQITRGLKEALAKGLDHAIANLGKDGGFLTNIDVRIPMPEKLQTVEKLMRRAGQDKLADDFVTTMNRAAEKAVPAAAGVFSDSLKQMTVEDARGILQGPKDAATQYFRRTAGPQLTQKFKPIVAQATSQSGATAAYKNLMDRASFATAFLKQENLDLDDYVTTKATDGLFKMVAEEEKKIRENPVARTTDLLKSVFGSLQKQTQAIHP